MMVTQVKSVREGYKITGLGEIPIDWELKKLGDIGVFSKGKGIAKKDLTELGHLCILYGELYTKYKDTINDVVSRTTIEPSKSVIGNYNDVLIPSSGETPFDIATASALNVNNVLIGGDINLFRPNKDILGSFISYSINSVRKTDLAKLAQGSSVYHLYSSSLSEFNVLVPALKEQQKIVEILSTVDEQIKNTDQLIRKTKEFKKGLMQQLLTKGIGHTKFKQTDLGEIPVEWEVNSIQDISDFCANGFVGTATPFYTDDKNGILYLQSNNVRENKFDFSKTVYVNSDFTEKYTRARVQTNDLLTVQSGHIGTSSVVTPLYDGTYCHALIITRPKVDILDSNYLAYYLNSNVGRKRLSNIFVGSTIKHINVKDFIKFLVPVPPVKEQQKIAQILSSVDEQIETYEQEKEKYTELKKGLMQQLLTGNIRVTV